MNLRCATRLIAGLLLLFAYPVRIQTLDDASVSASARSTTQVQGPVQAIRAFPRLNLGSGRDLVYVGMFSSDAKFRGSSKVTHFLDEMNAPLPDASRPPVGSAEQAAQQSGAPPWMLSRNSRFINDTAPPEHVRARAEGHSRAGEARDAVVSFVYGQPRLLRAPQAVTSDSQQRVVISDPAIPAVHILDPRRKTSFSILGGPGRRLQLPAGVAVDGDDNIYIADARRGVVLVYDRYGRFLRYLGTFHGEFVYQRPSGIAIDRKAGRLYLVDSPRHLIFVLDLEGNVLKRLGKVPDNSRIGELKSRDTGPSAFNNPTDIVVRDDTFTVLDMDGTRVQVMDLDGNLLASLQVLNTSSQGIARATGLAVDREGNIYVSYGKASEIRMYNRDGALLASFGQNGTRMGEFSVPRGLWIDANNRLYVADTENLRVQLFQLSAGNRVPECSSQNQVSTGRYPVQARACIRPRLKPAAGAQSCMLWAEGLPRKSQ